MSDSKPPDEDYVDESSGYPLPELLKTKTPYKHLITKEIRYMNLFELYLADTYSYHPEHDFQFRVWLPIEDSPALRALFYQKKKDTNELP